MPKTKPRRFSARSLSNLRGIHPDLRRVMDRALAESPLDFIVIEGLRTLDRQRELFDTGASTTLNSRHMTGHAVDLLPIGPDGKAAFDWPLYHKLGPAVEAAARAEGVKITWGGRWSSFPDGPHFELDWAAYPASDWTTATTAPKSPARIDAESPAPVVGAGGAAAAALLVDLLPAASGLVGQLQPFARDGAILVALAFVGWIIWKRGI